MTSRASSSLLATSVRSVAHRLRSCRPTSGYNVQCLMKYSTPSSKQSEPYLIRTSILLNRSPILTRPPTDFDTAMHEYYSRIGRALFNPFPSHFYFKPGSLLKTQFKQEEKTREKDAFNWKPKKRKQAGANHITTDNSKNELEEPSLKPSDKTDETTQNKDGGKTPEQASVLSSSSSDNVLSQNSLVATEEEQDVVMPRITEADEKNDIKSLDRLGHRNLYLLIKRGKGIPEWRLPGQQTDIQPHEALHQLAERELYIECGVSMDAWLVGRHPIGYMDDSVPQGPSEGGKYAGCKTFFYKAHILAGQVDPTTAGLADFAWLTKAEIQQAVRPEYWTSIRDMLSEF